MPLTRSLALLAAFGTLANSLRSNNASVLIRTLLRCSARPNGGGIPHGSSASRTSPEGLVRFAHFAGLGLPHSSRLTSRKGTARRATTQHPHASPLAMGNHKGCPTASFLTPTPSPLPPHSSLLRPHSSLLTPHSYDLTPTSSLLRPHSSLLPPHSSLLTPTTSLLPPHPSLLRPHPSLLNMQVARARAVTRGQSPAVTASAGTSQEPPTQTTLGRARNSLAFCWVTPPVGQKRTSK